MTALSKSTLSLLLLTAATTASPVASGADTVFSLTDIVFNWSDTYSAPPHISVYASDISFVLTNEAISRTTNCHVVSTGNLPADVFFNGQTNYICDGGVSAFRFTNGVNGDIFTVSDDTNAPGTFTATADLSCVETVTINPDWPATSPYKVESHVCTQAELLISAV